ncbi:hypothetical protein QTP70_030539 [Hemibagrus guttatus]|uniref:Secreted protein n=1 Tax=Hemibagrus guttatus TaxID=175788 RepID=A0AAE0RM50_9TELE|nr:hypothetical protein QTP70_030539 [Hemibagrus guttatus]
MQNMILSRNFLTFRVVLLTWWIHHCTWQTGEAIHPICKLVAQHMKAQEQCRYIRRQENRNRTTMTVLLTFLKFSQLLVAPPPSTT